MNGSHTTTTISFYQPYIDTHHCEEALLLHPELSHYHHYANNKDKMIPPHQNNLGNSSRVAAAGPRPPDRCGALIGSFCGPKPCHLCCQFCPAVQVFLDAPICIASNLLLYIK